MKPPSAAVRLLGHPLIAAPLFVVGGLLLIPCINAGGNGLIGTIPLLVGLSRLATANGEVMKYRAWKRAWAEMDGIAPRRVPWLALARFAVAALALFYGFVHFGDPQVRAALLMIITIFMVFGMVRLIQRVHGVLPSRRRAKQGAAVSVAVRGPLLPVPTLAQAYRALPEHCRCLLQIAHA